MKYINMRKYRLIVSFFALFCIAFGSVGGCNNNEGNEGDDTPSDAGCCVVGDNDCVDDLTQGECDGLGGSLEEDSCSFIPACNVPPPVAGCCVISDNDCVDDQTQVECDGLGGVLEEGNSCSVIPACNVPPPGTGCCVIGDNNCVDDQTQGECDGLGGMLQEGNSCSVIPACNVVPPLDGAALYSDFCAGCHGSNGGNVVGKSAQQISNAIANVSAMNSLSSLTAEEIDAIAAFLAP